VVIGGGHAGVEAAWAAAHLSPNACVALVTLDPTKIGVMSCNPAIGGLAKGQLVREIDALNGLMGLATDATGIQFRMLNTSKGPAVHGPRAQCDKHAYARVVQMMISSRPEIEVIPGSADEIRTQSGKVCGIVLRSPNGEITSIDCNAVVLTSGTFMRGLMHTGEKKSEGGRFGEAAAVGISGALTSLGFQLGRLKTGTPPRLKRSTIDWESLTPQYGDAEPVPFSDLTLAHQSQPTDSVSNPESWARACPSLSLFPVLPQVECRQTRTCAAIHDVIRANLHRAPMYSGQIEGVGPRYCPSLEDKVVKFSEREAHGVFLEPESLEDDWIYCNGISTSLPEDIQDQIVRNMPGCEKAEIYRYGYAVEYDMVRPHQIHATAMTKLVEGLFLAGQINGTSGYEEAAAQGLVAGLNAAKYVRNEPLHTFTRDSSYIGVMMDDLVTKTPVEPYRMFTSRAEHRLLLRADNAADRLTPLAQELGLLGSATNPLGAMRLTHLARKQSLMSLLHEQIIQTTTDGQPLEKLIRADIFELDKLRKAVSGVAYDRAAWMTALADRRYEAYVIRQRAEIKRQAEMELRKLPEHLDYGSLSGLRTEARHALTKFRPATFGQASRLEGITPADITLLAVLVRASRSR